MFAWIKKALQDIYGFFTSFFQFLDDKNGKFSHKRLIALAFATVAIRQLIIGDYWGALGAAVASIILAIVTAITGT